jgi:XTP/dITP diphosphohydrolase
VLATRNEHKVAELGRILAAAGFADRLTGLDAFPGAPDVPETGLTFADNALLKAHAIAAYTGLPAVADDSGLCVDALHGLDLVLGQLSDVAARGAQFVCVAALVLPPVPEIPDGNRREWTTTGVLAGELARAPRGSNGFGYDPIFVPVGMSVTTAQLAPEEKDAISHRGRAFRALAELIPAHVH